MATRELILREIIGLGEDQLEEVYNLIKKWIKPKTKNRKPTLPEKLKKIQIDGPEDFS